MKNHEEVGRGEDFDQEAVSTESEAREYEKHLEEMDHRRTAYRANISAAELAWDTSTGRGAYTIDSPPRKHYDSKSERTKKVVDRARLLKEAEALCDYEYCRENEKVPESKFYRHLADTCQERYHIAETVPLSNSEIEHFNHSAEVFAKNFRSLLTGDKKERLFGDYLKSLIKMCESAYGKGSRAEMYLCDDLNQIFNPDDPYRDPYKKSRMIDKLIKRKIDAASKIAIYGGKIKFLVNCHARNEEIFTATLDLPDGVENRSLKELVEEGIPSLYGYSEENH